MLRLGGRVARLEMWKEISRQEIGCVLHFSSALLELRCFFFDNGDSIGRLKVPLTVAPNWLPPNKGFTWSLGRGWGASRTWIEMQHKKVNQKYFRYDDDAMSQWLSPSSRDKANQRGQYSSQPLQWTSPRVTKCNRHDEVSQFSLAVKFTLLWGMNQKGIDGGLDEAGYCRCEDDTAHVWCAFPFSFFSTVGFLILMMILGIQGPCLMCVWQTFFWAATNPFLQSANMIHKTRLSLAVTRGQKI